MDSGPQAARPNTGNRPSLCDWCGSTGRESDQMAPLQQRRSDKRYLPGHQPVAACPRELDALSRFSTPSSGGDESCARRAAAGGLHLAVRAAWDARPDYRLGRSRSAVVSQQQDRHANERVGTGQHPARPPLRGIGQFCRRARISAIERRRTRQPRNCPERCVAAIGLERPGRHHAQPQQCLDRRGGQDRSRRDAGRQLRRQRQDQGQHHPAHHPAGRQSRVDRHFRRGPAQRGGGAGGYRRRLPDRAGQ